MKYIYIASMIFFISACPGAYAQPAGECLSTKLAAGCQPCNVPQNPPYTEDYIGCYECGGVCAVWIRSMQAAWQVFAETENRKKVIENTFAEISDIVAISQVSPSAAATLMLFHPEFFRPIKFMDGKSYSGKIPTTSSVYGVIHASSPEAMSVTFQQPPDDLKVKATWKFTKFPGQKYGIWQHETHLVDEQEIARTRLFPVIKIKTTELPPYRLVSWSYE